MDVDKLVPALKFTTIVGSGLMSGVAVYLQSADLPSIKEHNPGCILKILRLKFRRVARLQRDFAACGALSGISLYFIDKDKHLPYLVAGSLMAITFPFARFVVRPAAAPMIRPEAKDEMSEEEVRSALDTFQKRTAISSLAGFAAFGYLVYQLIK